MSLTALPQTAVYWGNPQPSGRGKYTYDNGVEVDCHWEETSELYRDFRGVEKVSQAIVTLDVDVVILGRLYLGDLEDLDSDLSDYTAVTSYLINRFEKFPAIGGGSFERTAYL